MQVSQAGRGGVTPEVLERFRNVVGVGNVTGPCRDYLYYWKTTRKDAIDMIVALLWPYLSRDKRSQLELMNLRAGKAVARVVDRTVGHREGRECLGGRVLRR